MVARGVVWASALALAVAFVACGGQSSEELAGESGEAGEVGAGGSTSAGGRGSSGRGPAGGTAGGVAVGGASGSVAVGGSAGTSIANGGTAGMCTPASSQGGWTGEDGCPIPWWGKSLDGAKGLLECPAPDDPALLAYGQTNQPTCTAITGPVAEGRSSEGDFSCCYHLDERPCCDGTYQDDICIEIPYFGDGTRSVELPTGAVEDPAIACARASGDSVELSRAEAADRMIGVWLRCGGDSESFFRDGVIFRGDGTFDALELGDDFGLSESEGCLESGLWGFYSDTGQVNLFVEDFTRIVFPTFTSGPEENLMLESGRYVRAALPIGG